MLMRLKINFTGGRAGSPVSRGVRGSIFAPRPCVFADGHCPSGGATPWNGVQRAGGRGGRLGAGAAGKWQGDALSKRFKGVLRMVKPGNVRGGIPQVAVGGVRGQRPEVGGQSSGVRGQEVGA
jgi:hypothetical protein